MESNIESGPTASQKFFESELAKATLAESEAQNTFNKLAVARLAAFGLIIFTAWIWNKTGDNMWALAIGILLIAFLYLMRKHQTVKRERDYQRNLKIINSDELDRLSFRFPRTDNGLQFVEKDHSYVGDLDIFGDYSLYKLINRTRTSEGSKRLANWLKNHADPKEIKLRQLASQDFKNAPHLIQSWEATALLHESAAQQIGPFRAWSAETLPEKLKSMLPWRWFPIVTLIIGILVFAKIIPALALLLSLGVHLFILKLFQPTILSLTNRTTELGNTLVAYADLLKNAESAPYQSDWWLKRKELITGSSASLKKAGALFARLDYRNNPYFAIFIGIPTLWDMHCLAGLENWKQENNARMWNWLDVLADTEAMNSIAGYAFANAACTIPEVTSQETVLIKTTDMGHPLIPPGKRVSNHFSIDGTGHTILVTGSNMSGKSTFLRTIGLNLVLAQMGAVVSATSFTCSPVRIFSSMRTQDSLEESTSSFYAELKRLRQLLDLATENAGTPVFYLLDEILKGTNSVDRHKGAEALIRQLHTKNASGLVSTHDLELGEWGATESYVHNCHFRSDVEEGRLHFDYRLHEGICRSFNASELMRMMGIEIDLPNKNSF